MPREIKRIRYVSDDITSSDDDSDYSPSSTTNTGTSNNETRPGPKPKCFSRNALMARENRLKKKIYIASLERQVGQLKMDNKKLAASARDQESTIRQLEKQVKYLRSVLKNSSALGQMIGKIRGTARK